MAEKDLFLAHPHPAGIHYEATAIVKECLFVFPLESQAGGAEKGDGSIPGESGNQQREICTPRVLEDLVHRSPLIGLEHSLAKRLCPGVPGVIFLLCGNQAEHLRRDLSSIDKGIGNAASDQGISQGCIRTDQDDTGAERLAELSGSETGSLASSHHQQRVSGTDS